MAAVRAGCPEARASVEAQAMDNQGRNLARLAERSGMLKMTTDFEFGVTLNTDDQLDVKLVIATLRDVENILSEIERSISADREAKAHWTWGEEAHLQFVASPNGVAGDTLGRVLEVVHDGFEGAMDAAQSNGGVEWPPEFGMRAQRSARRILQTLRHLESLTIETTGRPPLEIREARIEQLFTGQAVRRVYSSVEGILEMVARRGETVRAGLRENGTGTYVKCRLAADEWFDDLRDRALWGKRVLVEGRVAYDEAGTPLSIVDVTSVLERESGPRIRDFRGSAPNLTGGLSTEEFIARVRENA